MISAKLGLVFGSFLGNPYVILLLTVFLLFIALQSLEIINLPFLTSAQTQASKVGGKGFSGAFLMGTVSGFVAAPCIGPALIIVLSAAAKTQNITWGALLMFSYSLGLGTIFLVLATFSNLITKLPKSGNWLNAVKFILSALLFLIIIFIAQGYLSIILNSMLLNDYLILICLILLSLSMALRAYKVNSKALKIAAVLLFSLSTFKIFVSPPAMQINQFASEKINWITDYNEAIKKADAQNKILLIDFYADWCASCKEFEHITFSDKQVIGKLSGILTARIDFTDTSSEIAVKLTEKYQIPGLPVIMLVSPKTDGKEIPESRITGFINAEEFLTYLKKFSI